MNFVSLKNCLVTILIDLLCVVLLQRCLWVFFCSQLHSDLM